MISNNMPLFHSQFVKSVSYLTAATGFSQLFMLAALPLLTRLYSPEDFGVLAIFMAILGMLNAVSTLRYHIAIPKPRTDTMAANLLALSLCCVLLTSGLITITAVTLPSLLNHHLVPTNHFGYLWLLGVSTLIVGTYNSFRFWATRKKAFKRIAITRIEQGIGGVITQIGLGLCGFSAIGLVIGQMINQGAGFIGLVRRAIRDDKDLFSRINLRRMQLAANFYHRYPKFSTLEAFANTGSAQLPIIFIAFFTSNQELGFLLLAMRILQAPLSLLGTAIGQVYYADAAVENRSFQLVDRTEKVLNGLIKLGVGPILFVAILAPSLATIVFGQEWERTGVLIAWMSPWFMLQFLSSPISMALHIVDKQRLALALQMFGLILRLLAVIVAGAILMDNSVSEWYAVSGALFYLSYLAAITHSVGLGINRLYKSFILALPYILAWTTFAITIKFLFVSYPW